MISKLNQMIQNRYYKYTNQGIAEPITEQNLNILQNTKFLLYSEKSH